MPAERVRRIAKEIGFDEVGVTTADPFLDVLPELRRYYSEGRASGFEHPVAEERVDPQTVLPGARSLVAVALAYGSPRERVPSRPGHPHGVVSRYAWGMDYHTVMRVQLEKLARALSDAAGREISWKPAVDTTALLDRAVAVRAGIGWIGKNGLLITERHGSWVFLGSLVTDLDLEATDPPAHPGPAFPDCADCDLCISACPTQALTAPYTLDSSQCLSFVTQKKGEIPERYREPLGRRMWGCDTCQTVCPKNRGVLPGLEEAFIPDAGQAFPDPLRVLGLSGRQFRREYGHTAAAWRGYPVWKRNALIVLGNMRLRESLPEVARCLGDPRPEIRSAAAWACERIDPAAARPLVRAAWELETDDGARRDMEWAAAPEEARGPS